MFTNPEQLKDFISWCKDQKVKHVKVEGFEFTMADLAFIPDEDLSTPIPNFNAADSKTLTDTDPDQKREDDELLFWSSGR